MLGSKMFLQSNDGAILEVTNVCVHTNSFIAAVQQLCERGGGSLSLNGLSSFFILSQLTEDACCYTLDVFNGRIQQLQRHKP